jgi:hypothetical protein
VRFAIARLLVVLTVAVGGCGNDEPDRASGTPSRSTATQPTSVPLAEYIERADAICKRHRARATRQVRRDRRMMMLRGRLRPEDLLALNWTFNNMSLTVDDELRALPRPDDRADETLAYADAFEASARAGDDAGEAYLEGRRRQSQKLLKRSKRQASQAARLAQEIGFMECGSPASRVTRSGQPS